MVHKANVVGVVVLLRCMCHMCGCVGEPKKVEKAEFTVSDSSLFLFLGGSGTRGDAADAGDEEGARVVEGLLHGRPRAPGGRGGVAEMGAQRAVNLNGTHK